MSTVVLRPNGDGAGASAFQRLDGNTTNLYSVLDDSPADDTTGVIKLAGTANGTKRMNFDMESTTLSSAQTVRYVRVRARATAPVSSSRYDLQIGTVVSGLSYYSQPLSIRGEYDNPTNFSGGYFTFAPDGQAWNQDRLDKLFIQCTEYGENTGTVSAVSLLELYVDVVIANKPTIVVTNPSTTASSYPQVTWTYSDSDDDAQEYYQMKVFTSAQYGASDFSPATSTAFYDSGEVASFDAFATSLELVPNGTYKFYVKAGKKIAGSIYYSDWTTSTAVTMAVATPTVPTLTASYNSTTNSVSLSATGAIYSAGTQLFNFQRSDDGGTTWTNVTLGTNLVPSASYVASVTDYEAQRKTVYYRVRSVGTTSSSTFTSAWSSSSSVSVTNDKKWWFKPIDYPTFNMSGVKVNYGISETIVETTGVFRPLGRTNAVIVAGSIYQNDGNYQISLIDDTEWLAMQNVLKSQSIVLVQDPYGTQKYVRFITRELDLAGTSGRRVRSLKIDYIEVVP